MAMTNRAGRPSKGGPKPQINIKVNEATFDKIKARADDLFASPSELVTEVVEAAFSGGASPGNAGLADVREQTAKVDLQLKQERYLQARRQLVRVENVMALFSQRMTELRSAGTAFIRELAQESGANGREWESRYLDALRTTHEVPKAGVEKEAESFSKAAPFA